MPTDVFRERCTAHGMLNTTGHRTNMTQTETEVKEAMKKALDEPSAATEHRLLTRLDEPAPPKLLADNVEHKERPARM
jgi:hypothetical protein